MDPESKARVEALCRQLNHGTAVTRAIRDGHGDSQLRSLLALLTAPAEPDDAALTALLDKVDDAATRGGLQGLTTVVRTAVPDSPRHMPTLPIGVNQPPDIIGWSCPLRRCSRVVLADESVDTPSCAVGGNTGMLPYKVTSQ